MFNNFLKLWWHTWLKSFFVDDTIIWPGDVGRQVFCDICFFLVSPYYFGFRSRKVKNRYVWMSDNVCMLWALIGSQGLSGTSTRRYINAQSFSSDILQAGNWYDWLSCWTSCWKLHNVWGQGVIYRCVTVINHRGFSNDSYAVSLPNGETQHIYHILKYKLMVIDLSWFVIVFSFATKLAQTENGYCLLHTFQWFDTTTHILNYEAISTRFYQL